MIGVIGVRPTEKMLAAIRERSVWSEPSHAMLDRRLLLAEVDYLRAEVEGLRSASPHILPHPDTEALAMGGLEGCCEECSDDASYRCVVCGEALCVKHIATECLDQGQAHAWVLRESQKAKP